MASLTFVTGNANKLKEVKAILSSGADVDLKNQEVDVPEIQGTTQEVAKFKCKSAAQIIQTPCITEDTALCFDALQNLPGPYIKDFLKALGHDGLNKMLAGFENKSATALCTFAYCPSPDSEPKLFEGRTRGRIVLPRGPGHFGWDAIFQPDGFDQTFAEMDSAVKNGISHRYKALSELRAFLAEQQQQK